MTEQSVITFDLIPSNADRPLAVSVLYDQQTVWSTAALTQLQSVQIAVNDSESAAHGVQIQLDGKTTEHTEIDSNGNIVQDSVIEMKNFKIDEIEVMHMIDQIATYSHSFNGTKEPVIEKFYGIMGCNGTAEIKFESPTYLWLLENM